MEYVERTIAEHNVRSSEYLADGLLNLYSAEAINRIGFQALGYPITSIGSSAEAKIVIEALEKSDEV